MTVLLLSPPSRIMNHYRPPLALMYLSGYLKRGGVDTKIIDICFKNQVRTKRLYDNKDSILLETENKIINIVNSTDADIIGITCFTPELFEVEQLAAKIKIAKPDAIIIAGGIHPTLCPNDFLYPASNFDFVVIGEGEVVLLDLVKAIRSKSTDYRTVKGIGYYDKSASEVVLTERPSLVENLDEIAFPNYDDLDMNYYTTASPYAIRGVFTRSFYILSSRGCPSSCTFCAAKKLREYNGINKFVRLRSPQSLYNEIQELRIKYGIDSFYFIDDLFTLQKKNVYDFCSLMKKKKNHLVWGCSAKVNTVDYEMLKAMRDVGCIQLDFGIERGSNEALRYLRKGININQIEKIFKDCQTLGIRTFANMLVNIPNEEEKDLQDILELTKKIKPSIVTFNIFTPYPGSDLFDLHSKYFERKDYPLLMENPAVLMLKMPEKFKFASHSIDFRTWIKESTKKYNKLLPTVSICFDTRYLKTIIHSKHKYDYLKQLSNLFKEFINFKF